MLKKLFHFFVFLFAAAIPLLGLTGCQTTYHQRDFATLIPKTITQDWGVAVDQFKLENGNAGVLIRLDSIWDNQGKLTPAAHSIILGCSRSIEKILVSSDATAKVISVTATTADYFNNVYFERSYSKIRQSRAGAISAKDLYKDDQFKLVPDWQWGPFSDNYVYYPNYSFSQIQALIETRALAQYGLNVKSEIDGDKWLVYTRVSRLLDNNVLAVDISDKMLNILNATEVIATKVDHPPASISVTAIGGDTDLNSTYTDSMDNLRAQMNGKLTREQRRNLIQESTQAFYLNVLGKPISMLALPELTNFATTQIQVNLKNMPAISVQAGQFVIALKLSSNDYATLLNHNDILLNALKPIWRLVLLAQDKVSLLSLSLTAGDGRNSCLSFDPTALINYFKNVMTADQLFSQSKSLASCPLMAPKQ